jgi:hypothetical protein
MMLPEARRCPWIIVYVLSAYLFGFDLKVYFTHFTRGAEFDFSLAFVTRQPLYRKEILSNKLLYLSHLVPAVTITTDF